MSSYAPSSRYNLIVATIELAGIGAILQMLEERRKKLAAEGLFDEARKQLLPQFPARIGVITSPTGAVIRDIIHRVAERFRLHIIVWPVAVQGENSAAQLTAALNGFNALALDHNLRPDLLILARGGGSIEDLMPFNDEAVVRAVAASVIPIITAVGHETDTTLVDYASDLRAPTPTAAAEKATPVRTELLQKLLNAAQRAQLALARQLESARLKLHRSDSAMLHPRRQLEQFVLRLDDLSMRFEPLLARWLAQQGQTLIQLHARLRPPSERITIAQRSLAQISERMPTAMRNRLQRQIQQLESSAALLESYSYKNTLARGYALVMTEAGEIVKTAAAANDQATLQVKFTDGTIRAAPENL